MGITYIQRNFHMAAPLSDYGNNVSFPMPHMSMTTLASGVTPVRQNLDTCPAVHLLSLSHPELTKEEGT
jgi:hypothetical protein